MLMHEVSNEIKGVARDLAPLLKNQICCCNKILTIIPLSKIVLGVRWVDIISNSILQFFEGPKTKTKCAVRECSPGSKTNACERVLIHSIHKTFNCDNDFVVIHVYRNRISKKFGTKS